MTLKEFLQLSHEARLEAANVATCIGGREEGKFMVLLYQLDGFYIEVFYHKKYSQVMGLFGFDDMALLDPYLEKMEISVSY
jgi:hypothetical protein